MTSRSSLPDASKGVYIFASGRKGSGKSVCCRTWFDCYPYDRVVIDPTHDIRRDLVADGVEFVDLPADALPARLPAFDPQHPKTYVICPDMGSPTAVDDMDRAVGLALGRGVPTLLWIDEFGILTSEHVTPPNTRRALHHGRHDRLTLLLACPRPKRIDPLGIAQADLVYTFDLPNPADRERVANEIGWEPAAFNRVQQRAVSRGEHWHTCYKHATKELWIMPPLPRGRRRAAAGIARPGDLAPLDDAAELDELDQAARQPTSL